MKTRDLQPRLLYPAKIAFRIKGRIKSFPGKKKLKEFIIAKPLLYEMLKVLMYLYKKKVKIMNNKMAKKKSTNPSTIESKKQTKQTRRTEAESWIQRAF